MKTKEIKKKEDSITKPFTPYPTRPIRMSDKTWEKLKKQKLKTGKNWDKFIDDMVKLLENKK